MKFFPIRVALICLLAPPLLYAISLATCERVTSGHYTAKIRNIMIGDTRPLLDGSVRLEEQIALNIQRFIKQDRLINRLRFTIKVQVSTENGRVLYPVFTDLESLSRNSDPEFDSQAVAKENFTLLNTGLVVQVQTFLDYASLISILILSGYCLLSLSLFIFFYRTGSTRAARDRLEKKELIQSLQNQGRSQAQNLARMKKERTELFDRIEALNQQYQDAVAEAKGNEDDLFEEIIALEEKLTQFKDLKQNREAEISDLKGQIEKYERRKGSKNKRVDYDFMVKRFGSLYKNIVMNRKAVSGFLNLNDDQQIKAEEVVMLLNLEPEKVVVKRKVFSGKKHKAASFEVLFAYNGRLYFRKLESNQTEVLVIGTKNSQQKDMEFLHNL